MRTIIAGTRKIADEQLVFSILNAVEFKITEVVCGCAAGVDSIGKAWAESKGIAYKDFPADWLRDGKLTAGFVRNQRMADYADALVLIWDGESSGSADMLRRAKKARLRICQYNINTLGLLL